MRFLSVLAASSILCSIASARSYAYDDPTVPSKAEPVSTQPVQTSTIKPSSKKPAQGKTPPTNVAPASPRSSTVRTQAVENPPVKNGNLCIEEVCLNDEPKDLAHINWERVELPSGDYPLIRAVGDPEAIKTIGNYIGRGKIDGFGLKIISKVKGFCEYKNLFDGRYFNKKGEYVRVAFNVIVSPDGKKQKIVVALIERRIKGSQNLTQEQFDDLKSQAKQRYLGYLNDTNWLGYPSDFYSLKYPAASLKRDRDYKKNINYHTLRLESQFLNARFENNRQVVDPTGFFFTPSPSVYTYFPGCGSERKIEL